MTSTNTVHHEEFIRKTLGLEVSRVWRGSGTALFLELGFLSNTSSGDEGESAISIEWSWRVENSTTILLGSFSEDEDINLVSKLLEGASITEICFFGHLKELDISFSNKLRLTSYSTVEGDPEWSVRVGSTYLYIKSGMFTYELCNTN